MDIKLTPYNSELWETFRGAYGNVCEEVKIIMGDLEPPQNFLKLRRLDPEEKDSYRIAFDNLCENITHQLSFYDATYIVMPYMMKLLEKKEAEKDFDWQFTIICEMGICLATDIPGNMYSKLEDEEIKESYEASIALFQEKTKNFLNHYMEELKALDDDLKTYFVNALMAIFVDREAAFILALGGWEESEIFCSTCECEGDIYFDEEEDDSEDFVSTSFKNITPAPIKNNDNKSNDDTYNWYINILNQLGATRAITIISYYYGTLTCPQCNTTKTTIDFVKDFHFSDT